MPDISKRAASALIAVILVLSSAALPGCGVIIINDGSETSAQTTFDETTAISVPDTATAKTTTYKLITTGDAKTDAKATLDKIIVRDFGGVSVFVASTIPELFAPTTVGSDISEARYTRQKLVEGKLNTTILTIGGTSDEIFENLRIAEKAGTYYADIISVPLSQLGKFIAAGLLLRVNSLPFLDVGAEWYDAGCMTQATAGHNSAYTVLGDVNIEPGNLYSVFWNKNLAASVSAGNLYKLTYNGVWTWDYMLTCASAIADIDGSVYGLTSSADAETFISAFYAASGEQLFDTGSDGALSASFGTDRAGAVVDKLKKFFAADAGLLGSSTEIPVSQGITEFYTGNSGFIITTLGTAEWFKNMKPNWGILPMPKYDEAQEKYYAQIERGALSVSVPSSNANIETAGIFISALSAATGNLITDAFYTQLIKHVIRDNDSLNMMDVIRGGRTIGFADIFASGYSVIESGASGSLYNAVRGKASLGYYYRYYAKTLDAQVRKFT